jgi:ketosteroid isomerase-like protein
MSIDSRFFYFAANLRQRSLKLAFWGTLGCLILANAACKAQQTGLGPLSEPTASDPLLTSTVQPGTAFLFDLERKFAAAVAEGGGATFGSFFDKDGMTVQNRQAPLVGQSSIAAHATWSPATYQLTWTPEGGELSPAGDMGFTWGHYEGRSIGSAADTPVERGRYVTVWKKEPDGTWKIVMDTSNEDSPDADCKCSINGTP